MLSTLIIERGRCPQPEGTAVWRSTRAGRGVYTRSLLVQYLTVVKGRKKRFFRPFTTGKVLLSDGYFLPAREGGDKGGESGIGGLVVLRASDSEQMINSIAKCVGVQVLRAFDDEHAAIRTGGTLFQGKKSSSVNFSARRPWKTIFTSLYGSRP